MFRSAFIPAVSLAALMAAPAHAVSAEVEEALHCSALNGVFQTAIDPDRPETQPRDEELDAASQRWFDRALELAGSDDDAVHDRHDELLSNLFEEYYGKSLDGESTAYFDDMLKDCTKRETELFGQTD